MTFNVTGRHRLDRLQRRQRKKRRSGRSGEIWRQRSYWICWPSCKFYYFVAVVVRLLIPRSSTLLLFFYLLSIDDFFFVYLNIISRKYRGSRLIGRLGSRHSVPFILFSRLTDVNYTIRYEFVSKTSSRLTEYPIYPSPD